MTVADLPAASLRVMLSVLRDEFTRTWAGVTEMEERLRYNAGAEISVTWLTPILALKTSHLPFNETTLRSARSGMLRERARKS